jgi:hypothetical protein
MAKLKYAYPENLFREVFNDIPYESSFGERLIEFVENKTDIYEFDEREKTIIKARFVDGFSLNKVAESVGLKNGESVRQILWCKIFRKIKHPKTSRFIMTGNPEKQQLVVDPFWNVNGVNMDFVKDNVRIRNAFIRNDIATFGDAISLSKEELYSIKNLGKRSIELIIEYFERMGIDADKFK